MTRKRPLTPEEQKLWEMVMRDVIPSPLEGEAGAQRRVRGPVFNTKAPPTLRAAHKSACSQPLPLKGGAEIKPGAYANIDKNTANKFRKGDAPVDGTLDLHGMTRDKAHRSLYGFIKTHYDRGSRCLLVITGKGKKDGEGILRQALPQWISTEELKPLVLAFDVAKPKHGGNGAFYILLRRKRNKIGT